MQTVGLIKCKNKNSKYFNKVSKDALISINDLNIKQISSILINASIENSEYIKSISSLKLLVNLNLRIIYLKSNDKSLYVHDKNLLELVYIDIPNNLDGVDTHIAFIKNKIKFEIFVENLSSKLLNTEKLLVNYFLLINLKVNPIFSIAYNISNNFFDNLFLSYYDGKNLTQQTFTSDLDYSDITWQNSGSNIVFVGNKDDVYYINTLDYTSKSINKINSTLVNHPINSFCFINQNAIILSIRESGKDILYSYNLKQGQLKKYRYPNVSDNTTKPYYNNSLNCLLCLCKINEINCLCSIDKNSNLNILFNFANVYNFLLNEELNKVLIEVLKEKQVYFYTLDLENQNLTPVNFDFLYDKIIKIKYIKNKYYEEILVVLYTYNNKNYLRIFNLNKLASDVVYEDDNITSFDINNNNLDIFIIINNNIFSQVIKIDDDGESEILKIPSTIKSISIK